MEIQLGGTQQSSPASLIFAGIVILVLGSIWPLIESGDILDEIEAQSWETVDATVAYLEIDTYEYQCGDAESGDQTCTSYEVTYDLRYTVDGETYRLYDTEEVSYFQSRVWEVDYPTNSTREIAYDSQDPNNVDIDPGQFAEYLPALLVGLGCTLLASLFFIGAIKGILNPTQPVNPEEKSDIPYSDLPVHFETKKNVWGEIHYGHPSVEAVAQKMKLYACTDAQIRECFATCKTQSEQANNIVQFDRELLEVMEEVIEDHASEASNDFVGAAKKGAIGTAAMAIILLVVSLVVVIPLFQTYGAMPWYGWVLSLSTLGFSGLAILLGRMTFEISKFLDQGLGEVVLEIVNEFIDEFEEHESV